MLTALKKLAYRVRDFAAAPLLRRDAHLHGHLAATQVHLAQTYRTQVEQGLALPRLADTGFKVMSQNDEDGILLYLFAVIGATNKRCVELCAGNGIECNAANLIVHHGWQALLVDGSETLIDQGIRYYRRHPHTRSYPPTFVREWIRRDNVNRVVEQAGFAGEIDLLSLDLDGVDYWIWEALDVVQPRVVVVEYQEILGPERAATVPYADDFDAYRYPVTEGLPNFSSASLSAFVKLGRAKGYRLVGCNRYGFNAFFVRNPLGEPHLPEVDPSTCFSHPKVRWGMQHRYPTVEHLPWVDV